MAKVNLVYDTNIIIYHLNADPKVADYFAEDFLTKNKVCYSVITEIELLSFPKLTNDESKIIKSLLGRFLKLSLSEDIKEKTIEFRKNYKVGLGDSIIAASAFVNKAELVTRNQEDFSKITELDITNPFE